MAADAWESWRIVEPVLACSWEDLLAAELDGDHLSLADFPP
jgi:hypothetical protein